MRQTELSVDERSGRIELGISINDSNIEKANALLRKENPTGFSKQRSMRAIAEIPFDTLQLFALRGDKDAVTLFTTAADPIEKRKALRSFLFRYPEYRISDGRI